MTFRKFLLLLQTLVLLLSGPLNAQSLPPRRIPMSKAQFLAYRSETAKTVSVAGDFNEWCGSEVGQFDPARGKMSLNGPFRWVFPLTGFAQGSHQYKFIVDGVWEGGQNRVFHLDNNGRLFDPTGGITSVIMESPSEIRITFASEIILPTRLEELDFKLLPHGSILGMTRHKGKDGKGEAVDLHCRDLDITEEIRVQVKGISKKVVSRPVQLDGIFKLGFQSTKQLGPSVDNKPLTTV